MNQTLRLLSYPYRGGALAVNLVFSVILGLLILISHNTGVFALFSLPVWLLLLASFQGYCFKAGEQAADGSLDPPPAGYSQLSPFTLQPFLFLASLGVVYMALVALVDRLPAQLITAAILPAAAGAFMAHRPVYAINPVLWCRVILRLGLRYLPMAVLFVAMVLVIRYRPENIFLLAGISMTLAAFQGLFFGLGRLMYLNRELLGIEAPDSEDERVRQDESRRQDAEFRERVAAWHQLHARGQYRDAVDVMRAWLEANRAGIGEWERVFRALLEWQNSATAALFAAHLVDKLLGLKMAPRAFSHYQAIWDRHGPVALLSDTSLYRMAQLARTANRGDMAFRLLKNLPHLYPDSPLVGTCRAQAEALERDELGRRHG